MLSLGICFIMERKPKDIGEMSILAEQYLEVHGNT